MTPPALICAFLIGWTFGGSACGPAATPESGRSELLVFAAASLSDVLGEVGEAFENQSNADLVLNFNGSNVLAQQILATSKGDVFMSADQEWMDVVEQAGRLEAGTRRPFLSNTLVVIAPLGSSWEIDDPADLCRLKFRFLALGNPQAVPAGRYARQWLQTLACQDQSLWESIARRVSPAPNVRAALGQVEAAEDVLGIVYQTDYAAARDRVRLLYAISAGQGPSVRYAVARLQGSSHPLAAQSFLDFLFSDAARTLFERHGFLLPEDELVNEN